MRLGQVVQNCRGPTRGIDKSLTEYLYTSIALGIGHSPCQLYMSSRTVCCLISHFHFHFRFRTDILHTCSQDYTTMWGSFRLVPIIIVLKNWHGSVEVYILVPTIYPNLCFSIATGKKPRLAQLIVIKNASGGKVNAIKSVALYCTERLLGTFSLLILMDRN